MFDLVAGKVQRPLQDRKILPTLVSIAGHVVVVTAVVLPLLYVTNQLPQLPNMMAFVAEPAPLPPPPAPPPSPALPQQQAAPAASRPTTQEVPAPRVAAPPVEAPPAVVQEADVPEPASPTHGEGHAGDVGSGALGDVLGGLAGEKFAAEPPPPPPPLARPPDRPVRVGALVKAPDLIHRVEPAYPPVAVAAQVEGVVILEATVGVDGRVESVRVLASPSHLLDAAAVDAVQQWQYSPLLLQGTPASFVLTVTLNFSMHRRS